MWEYYLAYCEGAFAERNIGVVQAVFDKPLCRESVPLPSLDDESVDDAPTRGIPRGSGDREGSRS